MLCGNADEWELSMDRKQRQSVDAFVRRRPAKTKLSIFNFYRFRWHLTDIASTTRGCITIGNSNWHRLIILFFVLSWLIWQREFFFEWIKNWEKFFSNAEYVWLTFCCFCFVFLWLCLVLLCDYFVLLFWILFFELTCWRFRCWSSL